MKTYWNHKGKYQDTYDRYNKLIPKEGKASSYSIEVLRCFSNVYYDIYNNGGGNLEHGLREQVNFLGSARSWVEWYSGGKKIALDLMVLMTNDLSKENLEELADAVITAVHTCRSLGLTEDDPRKTRD